MNKRNRSSCSARSSSTEAVSMGSSSPAALTAAVTRVSLDVVVNGDFVGLRQRLTGEDVAGVDLTRFQGVIAAHDRPPFDDLRAAGAADAPLTGERQVGPGFLGTVEDGRAGRKGERGAAAVEDDGQAGAFADRGVVVGRLDGRLVPDPEQLAVDPAGVHP